MRRVNAGKYVKITYSMDQILIPSSHPPYINWQMAFAVWWEILLQNQNTGINFCQRSKLAANVSNRFPLRAFYRLQQFAS